MQQWIRDANVFHMYFIWAKLVDNHFMQRNACTRSIQYYICKHCLQYWNSTLWNSLNCERFHLLYNIQVNNIWARGSSMFASKLLVGSRIPGLSMNNFAIHIVIGMHSLWNTRSCIMDEHEDINVPYSVQGKSESSPDLLQNGAYSAFLLNKLFEMGWGQSRVQKIRSNQI